MFKFLKKKVGFIFVFLLLLTGAVIIFLEDAPGSFMGLLIIALSLPILWILFSFVLYKKHKNSTRIKRIFSILTIIACFFSLFMLPLPAVFKSYSVDSLVHLFLVFLTPTPFLISSLLLLSKSNRKINLFFVNLSVLLIFTSFFWFVLMSSVSFLFEDIISLLIYPLVVIFVWLTVASILALMLSMYIFKERDINISQKKLMSISLFLILIISFVTFFVNWNSSIACHNYNYFVVKEYDGIKKSRFNVLTQQSYDRFKDHIKEEDKPSFEVITDLKCLEKIKLAGNAGNDLNCKGMKIKELSSLDNLKYLNLRVKNLDLENIGELDNLEHLDLRCGSNLNTEHLSELSNLKYLDLSRSDISDFDFLSDLDSLIEVNLKSTDISDLKPLLGLKNLEKIDISKTSVSPEECEKQFSKEICLYRK